MFHVPSLTCEESISLQNTNIPLLNLVLYSFLLISGIVGVAVASLQDIVNVAV